MAFARLGETRLSLNLINTTFTVVVRPRDCRTGLAADRTVQMRQSEKKLATAYRKNTKCHFCRLDQKKGAERAVETADEVLADDTGAQIWR